MKKDMTITRHAILNHEFPKNLLLSIKGDFEIQIPEEITADILNGIKFVIFMLNDREQEFVKKRYIERKSLTEIGACFGVSSERARTINISILRKLRTVKYRIYFQKGLEGAIEFFSLSANNCGYEKGYKDGYCQGLDDAPKGIVKNGISINVFSLPLETLCLPEKILNCLKNAGFEKIKDIATLNKTEMSHIKGFTMKRRFEVAAALNKYGLIDYTSEWDLYLKAWISRNNEKNNEVT